LFYLVEYAVTPRIMAAAHNTDTCCHKKNQCPKPEKGCNPTTDCCLNCPMCYVTLLPTSPGRIGVQKPAQEYAVWRSSYVYLFQATCWKPPNAA
jgi:hypothetical protein